MFILPACPTVPITGKFTGGPFLQDKLGRALLPKRHFGNEVTRFIEDTHRVFQRRVLGFIREQLDLQYGFHSDDCIHKRILILTQPASDRALRGALSLPALKDGASRAIRVKPRP